MGLSAYGGLMRIVVKPNERYLVNPKHVVAWDSSLDLRPVADEALPFTKQPIRTSLAWLPPNTPDIIKKWAEGIVYRFKLWLQHLAHQAQFWIVGKRGLFQVQGSGDVFLATRLPPTWVVPEIKLPTQSQATPVVPKQ